MNEAADTIVALSSGAPPAAIAVVRMSGPSANRVAAAVAGRLAPPRYASLRRFRDPEDGEIIDRGLLLRFPAEASVTGEDVIEFHLHGGKAVIARMLSLLGTQPGCRPAEPGEFSRRALMNGRLGLIEAEALSDVLLAETESQRRAAFSVYDGALGDVLERWRIELLDVSAQAEALIDLDEEDDVAARSSGDTLSRRMMMLADAMAAAAGGHGIEALRDGALVVIAGPPNSGKSTLLNRLVDREAALVTPFAGTTRDAIEVPVTLAGTRVRLVDTAGLRTSDDPIERMGIARAGDLVEAADMLLWLGDEEPTAQAKRVIWLNPKCDLPEHRDIDGRHSVSALDGSGLGSLIDLIRADLRGAPREEELTLNIRQRSACRSMSSDLRAGSACRDPLVRAEYLRSSRATLDMLVGQVTSEDMLDQLFGTFCVGK